MTDRTVPPPPDYAKLGFEYVHHHERYVRHVNAMPRKLLCQECGGSGRVVEDRIDFGDSESGPIMFPIYGECGWCETTGLLTPHGRGAWLRYRKDAKAYERGHDLPHP